MTRVLVIGGAGFIGLHLARRLLARGDEIHLLDNFARGANDADLAELAAHPGVTLIGKSLLDAGIVESLGDDYDYIYHFAAIVGVNNVLERPYETLRDNVVLTSAAIDLGRRQKNLKRFVFTSTSEIYAGTGEKFELPLPTPESTPLCVTDLDAPRTSYMLSKICGESLCFYSGLPVTILRPHNVYGPRMGMSHVIPQLLQRAYAAKDGDDFDVFSVDHTRTFCYVDDAVEILVRAAEAEGTKGRALNLGNQAPEISIGKLAEVVLQVVGRQLNVVAKPPHPGSPARRCPDMGLTSSLIGFKAQVGLEQGVSKTFDWYRANVFGG